MPRLFLAIDPPEALAAELVEIGRAAAGARPVPREQVHLTLRFLGDTEDSAVPGLRTALEGVNGPALELTARSLGCFPDARRPSVGWVGLEDSPALLDLQAQVEDAVAGCGFERESRPFRPHLTLARWRRPDRRAAADWLAEHEAFAAPPFLVTAFHLVASELRPSGAVHRRLVSFPLAAAS